MKCNVCGKEFGNGAYCQNCGSDVITARGNYNDGGYCPPSQSVPNMTSSQASQSTLKNLGNSPVEKNVTIDENEDCGKASLPVYNSVNERPNAPLSDIQSFGLMNQRNLKSNEDMVCYNCAEIIPGDSIYCPCCGIKLFVECPRCGYQYSSRFKFCNQCGTNRCEEIWSILTGSPDGTKILYKERLKIPNHIGIPYKVTEIGDYGFCGCRGLTSITIPNSITRIGEYAFQGCIGLNSIVIPDSVAIIRDHTFEGCTGLNLIEIPNTVKTIGNYSFSGCQELTTIAIPNRVTEIGECAFNECKGLTSINIPDSVTKIRLWTFKGCTGLNVIKIPDGIEIIENRAFEGCTRLTSIEIPDSTREIGSYAFKGCSGLKSVIIPSNCKIAETSFPNTTTIIHKY